MEERKDERETVEGTVGAGDESESDEVATRDV